MSMFIMQQLQIICGHNLFLQSLGQKEDSLTFIWFDPQNQLKKLTSIVPTVLILLNITICCFVLCVQELTRITRLDLHCGWIYIWIHEDLLAGTYTAVTDPGEVQAPPCLFLDQTGAGRSETYFLETTPLLSQSLDPPPLISQGLALYYVLLASWQFF